MCLHARVVCDKVLQAGMFMLMLMKFAVDKVCSSLGYRLSMQCKHCKTKLFLNSTPKNAWHASMPCKKRCDYCC